MVGCRGHYKLVATLLNPNSWDGAVSPAVGASGGSAQSTGAPAAKFQLGETQPFVPVRIVKRILQRHFVEMAELLEENLGLELPRRRRRGRQSLDDA